MGGQSDTLELTVGLILAHKCLHADDACNQRFNNLSRACTKWLLARETVLSNPLNQGKDEDQLSGVCLRLVHSTMHVCTLPPKAQAEIFSCAYRYPHHHSFADVTQDAYKRLMNTDKSFKHFRVLDLLKNNEKWQEHSQALSARTREQVASGLSGAGKVRMPPIGQKMKVHRHIPAWAFSFLPAPFFACYYAWGQCSLVFSH